MDWTDIIRRQERLIRQVPTAEERGEELRCWHAMQRAFADILADKRTSKEGANHG